MLLNDLVATSASVKATSGRLAKIGHLADLLRRARADERRPHTVLRPTVLIASWVGASDHAAASAGTA